MILIHYPLLKRSLCLGVLFAGLLYSDVYGQGMYVPTTTRINTPYGPHNITTYHYQHMPWMYANGTSGPMSNVYEFTVMLKNDSIFQVKGKINWQDSVDYLNVKRRGEDLKIKVTDTKKIWRYGNNTGRQITGVATDSCWLFQSVKGAINCYAFVSEPGGIDYTIAIQEGDDGDIVALNKDNLLAITGSDDPAIMKLVNKKKLPAAIKTYNQKKARDAVRQ